MEPSKEPITVRISKLNSQIVGKAKLFDNLLTREGLLDALQVLYDECDTECMKNLDKKVLTFVERNKKVISEIKHSRVNMLDFELKNVIGRGNFGEVHLVKEKQTKDTYAMKIIKKHQSMEERNVAFQEERDIMAFNESLWLTKLQYAFQDNANLYFIMEYHPGGDLLGLLYRQGGTLPESAASFYIAEIIMALNDLHKMGYVHRDIKPDNVLMDRCGHLKLADFGSASKLNSNGLSSNSFAVGTPDYIAPEVLQCMNNKNQKTSTYGSACDYWSLGIVAYELVVGNTPFTGNNTASIYAKIMNYAQYLKFPTDIVLSQAYLSLIKGLITDQAKRLVHPRIIQQPLFKNVDFNSLRDQVPPYVPKITSIDDTSNFSDVQVKKNQPNIENFKRKTQFSGKNLPFIGFTFTQDLNSYKERYSATNIKDTVVDNMKSEMEGLKKTLMKCKDWEKEKEACENSLEELKIKLHSIESVRNNLEKQVAKYVAENSALKRTIDIEKKDRSQIERQALELIKSAKLKWETSEKMKMEPLNSEISQQKEKIHQLMEENEALKESLKLAKQLENTHKISLEKVEKINRKSVVGLESRLEKILYDSQNEIVFLKEELENERFEKKQVLDKLSSLTVLKNQLQDKLQIEQKKCIKFEVEVSEINKQIQSTKNNFVTANDEVITLKGEKRQLEDKINILNKTMIELKHEKKSVEANIDKEQEHAKKLRDKIEMLTKELEESNRNLKKKCESSSSDYEELFTKSQAEINAIKDQNSQLECKLQEAQQNDAENRRKVRELEDLLNRLESGLSKLENSSEREEVLQEQVERLEKQLMEIHEATALEKQELLKVKSTLWRCEKDLKNSNLDKKIVERDLVEVQNENKKLKDEIANMTSQLLSDKQTHEAALTELNNMNETMMNEIFKLTELNEHLTNEISLSKEKQTTEQNAVTQLKEQIYNKDCTINNMKMQIECLLKEKHHLSAAIEKKEVEKEQIIYELDKVNEARKLDIVARENAKIDLAKANENLKSLKEACTLLDNQLVEFEKLKVEYDAKEVNANYRIDQLTTDLNQAKAKITDAKKAINEEKSLKLMNESKYKRLLDENETLKNDIEDIKNQREEFKSYANSLSDELTIIEEKLTESEAINASNDRKISNYMAENKVLKEENSSHITRISNLKESMFNLNQNLSILKGEHEVLIEKFQELENAHFDKLNYYAERELKFNSTVQQQTKLIDFLQLKIDECTKKKRSLTDKLFGQSKKENISPLPMNYKDIEKELKKEKLLNNNLREELYKMKSCSSPAFYSRNDSKIFKDHQKQILEKIVQSPSKVNSDLPRQQSMQRMRHKIPHRFETKITTRLTKCVYCNSQLYLGKSSSICQECNIIVHTACVPLVPKTCGLPSAYVQHFTDTVQKNASETKKEINSDALNLEGWIKIPNYDNHNWDKCYACLVGSTLKVFTSKPIPNLVPIKEIDLLSTDGQSKLILEPSPSEIDVPVANSDLSYILKVELYHNSTCFPSKCFVFMTLSLEEKEKWFQALESVLKPSQKYNGEEILLLNESMDVNCAINILANNLLLGTDKGLYSYHNNCLVHINGLQSAHQIALIDSLHMALMIVNTNRILIKCDLNHLKDVSQCAPCVNPALKFSNINISNLTGFHILETSHCNKQLTLCVATNKQVVVLTYDRDLDTFKPVRILDTAEPTSCMLFTPHSLIIGADKFFEVDLNSFEADEFLDASDHKLGHAIMCSSIGSFPLGIIQISRNPREYLVCFKEFATYVDEYGRSTREADLKWSHFPTAFFYHAPYLYIVTFVSVEVIKISFNGDSGDEAAFRIGFNNLRYLGNKKNGIYIKTGSEIRLVEAKALDCDNISISTSDSEINTENQDSDRFSFTSSMMNSLDENFSDDDDNCNKNNGRKVKFTDL